MFSLPSASTRLSSQAGNAPVSTDLVAVFAACRLNADGVPRLYTSVAALLDTHDYCEGAEYAALHMQDTRKPVLFVPLPIGTAGSVGRQHSVHTGTSKVSAAAHANGVLAEIDSGILKVATGGGGTVGTDQIVLDLSLDDGRTYLPLRLGTALSLTIPRIGIVISFGVGTLVAGDTILEFTSVAPIFNTVGVDLGKTKMIAQQLGVRSWLFVGDMSTLALTEAGETAVNAYETSAERFTYGKMQLRDRRKARASAIRVAMVGAPQLTFAEVGATGDTITRATGSWVTDGFEVGDYVRISGTASNNVSGKVNAVTATVLTMDTTDLTPEVITSSAVRITSEPSITIAGAGPSTLTRNRGSWVADGFIVGDSVTPDGVSFYTVTAVTATVLTISQAISGTVGGMVTEGAIYAEESSTAWRTALAALVSAVDGSKRIDLGVGRLKKLSPITGYKMRRPFQWADSIRSYQHDVKTATWQKDLGPLDGWDIEGEHDERVDGGLLANRISCARTWGNGPEGAFVAMSLTRATDGDVLGMTHNIAVANVAQTVCQRRTEDFVGRTLVLNADGTLTKSAIADLEAEVNADLQTNLLSNIGGEGQRASIAKWTAATNDNLSALPATLNGTLTLKLNGTLVKIATSVEVS